MRPYRDAPPPEPESPPPRRPMLPTIGGAVAFVAWSLVALAILTGIFGDAGTVLGVFALLASVMAYLGARTT